MVDGPDVVDEMDKATVRFVRRVDIVHRFSIEATRS